MRGPPMLSTSFVILDVFFVVIVFVISILLRVVNAFPVVIRLRIGMIHGYVVHHLVKKT